MTTDQTDGPAQRDAVEPEPAVGDFSRDAGASTAAEYMRDYWSRLRGGEVGAVPAVLALLVLVVIFSRANGQFLTVFNLANLVSQAGITVLLAMGLIFVLLLGEIDLAAGTASGACAAVMGLALVHKGDIHAAFGTTTFVALLVFMAASVAVAVISRLWIPGGLVAIGIVMMLTNVAAGTQLGAVYLAVSSGVSIGLVTGFLVARIGIPSFVVTLALFLGWQGVLLQFIGSGASIPVGSFPLINGISNGNMPPLYGWIFFALAVGGYGGYTLYRSVRRRAEALSAEPLSIVGARIVGLALVGAVGLFLLNKERSPNPSATSIKGAPYVLPLIIALMIFWSLVLTKTRFGRYVYAVGGNSEAASRAGIDLSRIRIAAFTIASGMAAVGGVVQASRLGAVPSDAGGGNTLLYAVAAAVIGGTSLFGGRGRARDAVIGGLVIAMIPNGLGLLANLPSSVNFLITAVVLLLAASVDALSRRRSTASR